MARLQRDAPDGPGLHRAELVFSGKKWSDPSVAELRARARANPGAYWIFGNEPNIPGPGRRGPADVRTATHTFAARLSAVDTAARIVGGNLMNWNSGCSGCSNGGFELGRTWVSAFLLWYVHLYGFPPPIDVWGVHSYDMNWNRTPMVNAGRLETDLTDMRAGLDTIPSEYGKPIWVTEFGVVWGYDGWAVRTVSGTKQVVPHGLLRQDRIAGSSRSSAIGSRCTARR